MSPAFLAWLRETVTGQPGSFFYANTMPDVCFMFYVLCILYKHSPKSVVGTSSALLKVYAAGLVALFPIRSGPVLLSNIIKRSNQKNEIKESRAV